MNPSHCSHNFPAFCYLWNINKDLFMLECVFLLSLTHTHLHVQWYELILLICLHILSWQSFMCKIFNTYQLNRLMGDKQNTCNTSIIIMTSIHNNLHGDWTSRSEKSQWAPAKTILPSPHQHRNDKGYY